MIAVVLAAGQGTRLMPLTSDRPKAMVLFRGKPLLEHVLLSLDKAGVKEAVIVVGYRKEKIKGYFGERFQGMKISYVFQRIRMGNAQAIYLLRNKLKDDFLVAYTDVLPEPSLWKQLMQKKGFDAVLALRKEKSPERFCSAEFDKEKITSIVEKPRKAQVKGEWINMGAYRFSAKIFKACKNTKISKRGEFEVTDSIKLLMKKGKVGYVLYSGKYFDIGTAGDLKGTERDEIH